MCGLHQMKKIYHKEVHCLLNEYDAEAEIGKWIFV